MQLLTVARRAGLGKFLTKSMYEAISKLSAAKAYDTAVRQANLGNAEMQFHDSILLMGICSILESFLTDVSVEFLICFPGRLESKQFQLDSLVKRGSVSGLLREAAEKEINNVSYRVFPEMFDYMHSLFSPKIQIDKRLVEEANEMKCTRDVYVHGNGKCNAVYLRKVGTLARAKIDDILPLGKDYLNSVIDKATSLITEFFNSGPSQFLTYGKTRAFREMWDATHLKSVMEFDAAWTVEGDDMVRPKEKAFQWAWSHSEKALLDFFLGVFSTTHPERSTDTIVALKKFPPATEEGQVILSWMDAPFWF
jgi:hypothetical protein